MLTFRMYNGVHRLLNNSGGGRVSRTNNRGPAHLSHNAPSQQNLQTGRGSGGRRTTAQLSQAEAMGIDVDATFGKQP